MSCNRKSVQLQSTLCVYTRLVVTSARRLKCVTLYLSLADVRKKYYQFSSCGSRGQSELVPFSVVATVRVACGHCSDPNIVAL